MMAGTKEAWIKRREKTLKAYLLNRIAVLKNGCWKWKLKLNEDGYGHGCYDGKSFSAHLGSYFCFKGKIPKGKIVRHKCDHPYCINPKHLVSGTVKQNMKDFMLRNPRAEEILQAAGKMVGNWGTKEDRSIRAKKAAAAMSKETKFNRSSKAGKSLWSKMKTKKERKEFRVGVKNFWSSMSNDERAIFIKQRTLKIIEGHRRGGNSKFGKGVQS